MAVSTNWVGPLCGCSYSKSTTCVESISGPLMLETAIGALGKRTGVPLGGWHGLQDTLCLQPIKDPFREDSFQVPFLVRV